MQKHLSTIFVALSILVFNPRISAAFGNNDLDATLDTAWQTSASNLSLSKCSEQFDKRKWQQWLEQDHSFIDRHSLTLLGMIDKSHPRSLIDPNVRLKERWGFLQSYPVIGMKREEILKLLGPPSSIPKQTEEDGFDVNYYQLNQMYCVPKPLLYLVFKYFNGRVCAFRMEHIKPPDVGPELAHTQPPSVPISRFQRFRLSR